MRWEVEQKYRLTSFTTVRETLSALQVVWVAPAIQTDRYFNHPARDFFRTDEAFRLRQTNERNWVTYKGPKIDLATKTRRELELPLPDGNATGEQFAELFIALGFVAVGTVRKSRELGRLTWKGLDVEVALDNVEGLGQFLELEIAADDQGLAPAQANLHSLARYLGLELSERRSYLELLLGTSPNS